MSGWVIGIYTSPIRMQPMVPVDSIKVEPGQGIEGDRYGLLAAKYGKKLGPQFELTLIEAEAVEAFARDYGVPFTAAESRRNVATRDVALNHLVGREFRIGEVSLRGIKLCEPCRLLADITGKDVIRGLRHRGGLRAQVLVQGMIRIGDAVEVAPAEQNRNSP